MSFLRCAFWLALYNEQYSHSKGFSPVCVRRCLVRSIWWADLKGHRVQWNRFTPVWTDMCTVTCDDVLALNSVGNDLWCTQPSLLQVNKSTFLTKVLITLLAFWRFNTTMSSQMNCKTAFILRLIITLRTRVYCNSLRSQHLQFLQLYHLLLRQYEDWYKLLQQPHVHHSSTSGSYLIWTLKNKELVWSD